MMVKLNEMMAMMMTLWLACATHSGEKEWQLWMSSALMWIVTSSAQRRGRQMWRGSNSKPKILKLRQMSRGIRAALMKQKREIMTICHYIFQKLSLCLRTATSLFIIEMKIIFKKVTTTGSMKNIKKYTVQLEEKSLHSGVALKLLQLSYIQQDFKAQVELVMRICCRVKSSYQSTNSPISTDTNRKIIVTATNRNRKSTKKTNPHLRNFSVLLRFKFYHATPSGSILHDLKHGFSRPSPYRVGLGKKGRQLRGEVFDCSSFFLEEGFWNVRKTQQGSYIF